MAVNKKVAWAVLLLSVLLMLWLKGINIFSTKSSKDKLWLSWLKEHDISDLKDPLQQYGISSVEELLQVSSTEVQLNQLIQMNTEQHYNLLRAIDKVLFIRWLESKQLIAIQDILKDSGITTLDALYTLEEASLNTITLKIKSKSDQFQFKEEIAQLKQSRSNIHKEKPSSIGSTVTVILLLLLFVFVLLVGLYMCLVHLVARVTTIVFESLMHIIITVVWVAVAGVFLGILKGITGRSFPFPSPPSFNQSQTRANIMNSTSQNRSGRGGVNEFRLGLYDRITGRNVDVTKCKVEWNHSDEYEVGRPSVATISFLCRNNSAYKLQASDNIQISIRHINSRSVIPHVIEPSSPVNISTIKISYTTRLSGEYTIDIKLNGVRIGHGNLMYRKYLPGVVDASKTVFLQQDNIIVVTAGLYHCMQVAPKDCFGNPANISQTFLTAEIRKGGPYGEPINPECVVDAVDNSANRYDILLKVESAGHFVGCVKYRDAVIGPPSITIISLTESDSATVDKNVAKKCNVYYEAQLIAHGAKPRKVFCYPSQKQLQVKEFFIGIFPRRVYTCKVSPSTRVICQEQSDLFILDDGYQSPVSLTSQHREILVATFYKFLLKNIGGSEKFQDKQSFFYNEVKKLRSYHTRGEVNLVINRSNLLENAMNATKHLSTSDWYKKFYIEFQGEEGLDWGGVSREFIELISVRCFDPLYSLYMRFSDNPQALVHPNHKRPNNLKLKHFEFAGRIVGKSLYESALGHKLMVKARFTRSFLAQIIGLRINHKYFESDIPELYTTKIQYIRDNDVTDLGLVFAEEEFDNLGGPPTIVPLIDKGEEIEVTNKNKLQYLNLLAQYKLAKSVKEEVEHFLKGLNDIIPDHLLSIFDENELELLMCGMGRVSYNDLKIHAVVSGSNEDFRKVISWFWTIISGYSQEEMAKLLQFVTGCSQLPPGGFKDLSPAFQIISTPTSGRLPTAHTCFNQLCLPSYDSFEQFQHALTVALNEGSEGFGFA